MKNLNWYEGKKVILTGHTGFKGAWMSLLLLRLGAEVHGISLKPEGDSLYESLDGIDSDLASSLEFDITMGGNELREHISKIQPDCIIHMAAQSLVRRSYSNPTDTFNTNVIGTARLLEAALYTESIKWILVVTTDKVYMNLEHGLPFRESDKLSGSDPYSASKVGTEMVANAFRVIASSKSAYRVGVARAGNVIGGGDRCEDRLVPDVVRNFCSGQKVMIRNPNSIRPWQHVLDCLTGYLFYGIELATNSTYPKELNFGPMDSKVFSVKEVVHYLSESWPNCPGYTMQPFAAELDPKPESSQLLVDSTLAMSSLKWKNQLDVEEALDWVVEWELDFENPMVTRTLNQIDKYLLEVQ
jgi:CDP-glucose 4,6-dehydratase